MGLLRKVTGKTVSRKDAPVKQVQKRFNGINLVRWERFDR